MHIHILGICGTFMGGVAVLARQAGHSVSGSDMNVYPPMSTQLREQGIELMEGYDPRCLEPSPDMVVVGNVMTRGNPVVEAMLDRGIPYTSGPQWLREHVLRERWVLAVAGTHGKTTTSSMLAWILEYAGLKPGFLIGGIPGNFGISARLGETPFFVVEADEYDTAFFDKRSKFVHYQPRTLILNNLEFDHADIFPDLSAIERQFHHLVRTVPGQGLIVVNAEDDNLGRVLDMGCWTPREAFSASGNAAQHGWQANLREADGSAFDISFQGAAQGTLRWQQLGMHNVANALAAIAAARHAGVPTGVAIEALACFNGVKRRMELRGEYGNVRLYDDFAHHPTAIATTLAGLRKRVGKQRIIVLLEPRSNTMRMGVHRAQLAPSLTEADAVLLYQPPDLDWNLADVVGQLDSRGMLFRDIDEMVRHVEQQVRSGDHIVVMSNGGFGGIHARLLQMLQQKWGAA